MISNTKKNVIDLFLLKNNKDLINVELVFSKFLKKLFKNKSKNFYKKIQCACGSKNILKKINIEFFEYRQCVCRTFYVNPMIKDSTLDLIYSNKGPYALYRKKFIENKSKKNLRMNKINKRKVKQVLKILKNKNKKLLDFGCGDGGFLKVCKKYGIKNLSGVDTKYSSQEKFNNMSFFHSLNDLNKNDKFDCITLWGVLEHLNEPIKFLKLIKAFLKRGGHIILEVPNSDSFLMHYAVTHQKKLNRFLEPGRHLYFFSKKFLEILANKLNMKLIDFETNGLDLQTIIGPSNKKITKSILENQENLDLMKMSDHLRFVIQKK